jgi:hypothetical protein
LPNLLGRAFYWRNLGFTYVIAAVRQRWCGTMGGMDGIERAFVSLAVVCFFALIAGGVAALVILP